MAKRRIPEVAEAFGEEIDEFEEPTEIADPITPSPVVPVAASPAPVAPMAPITLTFEQLQTLLASAKPNESNADLVAAFTKGIENAREPIPENKFSPGISTLNPLGEHKFPRPGLKCDFFLGTMDAKSGQVFRTYPFDANDLTAYEQIALNTLTPISGVIERLDEFPMKVSIVPTRDPVTDEITRMVIVVPTEVIAKGSQVKNLLPNLVNMVAQLTGKDFAKLSHDDLAWFMAEHRKKNYVAVREPVAA